MLTLLSILLKLLRNACCGTNVLAIPVTVTSTMPTNTLMGSPTSSTMTLSWNAAPLAYKRNNKRNLQALIPPKRQLELIRVYRLTLPSLEPNPRTLLTIVTFLALTGKLVTS
ncbi:hypothetical protein IV203_008479 [Nitzschia inconspicua]|uniref:Secreted protein n=1 Tax=Nitzschia inconspicua TaxID=303405 RepID=A0A9K3KZ98_9STRA|nr:hypothetical protein IV203_008479 [Nitzschia inconspicua]